jgi:hypothetical protein
VTTAGGRDDDAAVAQGSEPPGAETRDKSRLQELRTVLTGSQRELINEFWRHYRESGKWPLTRPVHSQRGKQAVRECLRGLSGDIVREARDSQFGHHYKLSVIGILLTDKGADYFALLVQYMEFLRKQYKVAPERLDFSDEDFRQTLKLSGEQLKILGEFVRLDRLGYSGSNGGDSWTVRAPDEVEDLPEDGPLDQPLETLLFRSFRPTEPAFIDDWQRQSATASLSNPSGADTETVSSETGIVVDVLKRRYQVFVSSTYEDLVEERQHVSQALLETRCIPVGMELFPAASVEQWELIKRVIDGCDYYLVITAGRYGSVHESGIGYTEMEFDYAVSSGKPVIGFYHKDPSSLPGTKTEQTDKGRERLKTFAEKVRKRLCRSWSSPAELGSAVKSAILNELDTNLQPGWIRSNEVQNSLMVQRLKQRIADLEEKCRTYGLL